MKHLGGLRGWAGIFALAIACGYAHRACVAAPNVIVIVADDGGYSDYGFSAAINNRTTPNETPNLDALAQRSVVATQAYIAAPICGPSRTGLLTGQYQQRYGQEENLSSTPADSGTWGLNDQQVTIAERLKTLGYHTGVIGKWHQGYVDGLNRPLDKGFDEFYGFLGGGRPYWTVGGTGRGIWKNKQFYENQFKTGGDPSKYDPVHGRHITDAFGEEAVDFINRHADDEQPFFLYLPFNAPHTPYGAKQVDLDHFAHLTDSTQRNRAALLYSMDRSIGEILGALESNGIDDDTMVVFMNDNGAPSNAGNNKPHRGHKGTNWEGGIRTPMLIKGPGLQSGRYDGPITAYDLLPTLVAAAGGDVSQIATDGYDVMPQLTGQSSEDPHEVMFWRTFTTWAVRKGDWKLTIPTTSTTTRALYNLALDPSEVTTYNALHRDVEAELLSELAHWEAKLAKPKWGILSADNQNQFDHFVYRSEQTTAGNWSTADNWLEAGSNTLATMKPADAYANAVLEFKVRNDADFRATNDMKRMSRQTFMLNQIRLTGDFAGSAQRRGTIDGNAVLMVKNLDGQLPEIRLDATSSGTPAGYAFQWDTEVQLLDDLRISGNGTEQFVINGRIRDYYEPGAPDDPAIVSPHHVTKTGTSQVTFAGDNTFGGGLAVEGGRVVVSGPSAAIRGAQEIVIGSAGNLTLDDGTIAVDSLDNSAGGAFDFHGGLLQVRHVVGNLQNHGGTFAPGASPALSDISGNYTQSAGVFQVELSGPAIGTQYDRLVVHGTASLAGTLDIRLVNGFAPAAGQTFEFLSAMGGIDGTFTHAVFPELNDGLTWNLYYESDVVSLVVGPPVDRGDPLVGDYNKNGSVDGADYTVWRNTFGKSGPDLAADGDGDHVVGNADLAIWKLRFGNLSPSRTGDFNADGIVDAADYTVWRNSLGRLGTDLAADANGDFRVDDADYDLWKSRFGAVMPSRRGDYNQDGNIDAADYTVWRNSLGQEGPGLHADGNGDFRVDEADRIYWLERYGGLPEGAGGGSGGIAGTIGVPEPSALALVGTALLALLPARNSSLRLRRRDD